MARPDFQSEGYQDGFNDDECFLAFDTPLQREEYLRGLDHGKRDREEIQRANSSNT